MSDHDFYEDSVPFWTERDDRALADQLEHDRLDAAHERRLDRRDRDLEMRTLSEDVQAHSRETSGAETFAGKRHVGEAVLGDRAVIERVKEPDVTDSLPSPLSVLDTGMCLYCRTTSALPGDDFCSACAAEVFGPVGDTAA